MQSFTPTRLTSPNGESCTSEVVSVLARTHQLQGTTSAFLGLQFNFELASLPYFCTMLGKSLSCQVWFYTGHAVYLWQGKGVNAKQRKTGRQLHGDVQRHLKLPTETIVQDIREVTPLPLSFCQSSILPSECNFWLHLLACSFLFRIQSDVVWQSQRSMLGYLVLLFCNLGILTKGWRVFWSCTFESTLLSNLWDTWYCGLHMVS